MDLTKEEAKRIAEVIEESVLDIYKNKTSADVDWLCEVLDSYKRLAEYSGYKLYPKAQSNPEDLEANAKLAAQIKKLSEENTQLTIECSRVGELESQIKVLQKQLSNETTLRRKAEDEIQSFKIDIGKVLALDEAGWAMNKIADEMKVSSRTIDILLKREHKKEKQSEATA